MGISIYYESHRSKPLDKVERRKIDEIVEKGSVNSEIEKYIETGIGLNWESFCIYGNENPKTNMSIVFEGSTKLPDNSEDATWIGVQHWCKVLTEIRHVLNDAKWKVAVEDHEIFWDDTKGEYDPTK